MATYQISLCRCTLKNKFINIDCSKFLAQILNSTFSLSVYQKNNITRKRCSNQQLDTISARHIGTKEELLPLLNQNILPSCQDLRGWSVVGGVVTGRPHALSHFTKLQNYKRESKHWAKSLLIVLPIEILTELFKKRHINLDKMTENN